MPNHSDNDLFEGEVPYEIAKRLTKAIREGELNFDNEIEDVIKDLYSVVKDEGEEITEYKIRESIEENRSKLAGPFPEKWHPG